jgi:hypothetical protein
LGRPVILASLFTFDENRITTVHHRPFNELPDDINALFHVY